MQNDEGHRCCRVFLHVGTMQQVKAGKCCERWLGTAGTSPAAMWNRPSGLPERQLFQERLMAGAQNWTGKGGCQAQGDGILFRSPPLPSLCFSSALWSCNEFCSYRFFWGALTCNGFCSLCSSPQQGRMVRNTSIIKPFFCLWWG